MSARLLSVAAVAAAAALLGAYVLAGVTEAPRPPAARDAGAVVHHEPHAGLELVRFGADGDSITTLEYLGQPRGELSWVNWAASPAVVYAGGYAWSGATTRDVGAAAGPIAGADALVVMLGTNDTRQGISWAVSSAYLLRISATSGLPASRVIVSAIAPADQYAGAAAAYNVQLRALAAAAGWVYVDPWPAMRNEAGGWLPGTSYDGAHPNGASQAIAGAILRDAIWAAVHPKSLVDVTPGVTR